MRDLLQFGLGNAATALVLAMAAALLARRQRRPHAVWALWALVLARLVVPPLWAIPVRVPSSAPPPSVAEANVAYAPPSLAELVSANPHASSESAIQPSALSRGETLAAAPADYFGKHVQADYVGAAETIAFALWITGALVLTAIVAARVLRFHRLVRLAPLAEASLQNQANACARRLGLRATPVVRIVEGRLPPLVWGLGKTTVLLPRPLLARLDRGQLRTLLAHELAHVRRRDHWMRWFETLTVIAWWWCPAAWWARSRLQQAEEECCDLAVLRALPGRAKAYAAALLETAAFLSEGRSAAPPLASGFGRVNLLKRRFEMILHGSPRRPTWKGRALLTAFAAVAISCSAYAVWGEEENAQSPSIVQRLERLEKLVEKLIAREEATASPKPNAAPPAAPYNHRDRNDDGVAATKWSDLKEYREQWLQKQEQRIQDALKKRVEVSFENRPLSEVMEQLSAATGIDIHLNTEDMAAEGVSSDAAINIQLRAPVSLNSALNLILEPLHLSYVIRNEVLEVTSETVQRGPLVTKVYSVADLVVPIPMFHGSLPGSKETLADWTKQQAEHPNRKPNLVSPLMLASPAAVTKTTPKTEPSESKAPEADFDSLTNLITTTVAPFSWELGGGNGAIQPHAGNLSLVISQTQEIHEEIADLLEQLRRLTDVQIVIETRTLTVPQNFFERIGVDFDFNVNAAGSIRPIEFSVVGEDGVERIGVDFDFTQGSTDAEKTAAGQAPILTEKQTHLLLEAVQGDPRSNVLAAPKLTIFNGQRAFISFGAVTPPSTKQSAFARMFSRRRDPPAPQSIALGLQGVVSNDRRQVRLSLAQLTAPQTPVPSAADDAQDQVDVLAAEPAPAPAKDTTLNIPDGRTLLLDGGELPSATGGRKTESSRLLFMVTPRIVIVEEEETKLGIDLAP